MKIRTYLFILLLVLLSKSPVDVTTIVDIWSCLPLLVIEEQKNNIYKGETQKEEEEEKTYTF